jgi:hypothetical protein
MLSRTAVTKLTAFAAANRIDYLCWSENDFGVVRGVIEPFPLVVRTVVNVIPQQA